MNNTYQVSALYFYPIKSCKGIPIKTASIDTTGIKHDREFMVINPETNRFYTQRELPTMSRIEAQVKDKDITVKTPNSTVLKIPITKKGNTIHVTIWKDTVEAVDQGDTVAMYLSNYLNKPVRLVRRSPDSMRRVNPKYALKETDQVNFADGYPFLIISEESLNDLNSRLAEPLPMNRFRPNIVIKGFTPYQEDTIKRLKIGSVTFTTIKPCVRCVITTTDQDLSTRAKEPLTTLAKYRKTEKGVIFGQNTIHENTGTIHVGDQVEIPETK